MANKYQSSSIKQIQANINNIGNYIEGQQSCNFQIHLLEDANYVCSLIEKMDISAGTKRKLVWAIEAVLATTGKNFPQYDKVWQKYVRIEKEEQYSKERHISDITLMDIEEKIDHAKDPETRLILALYAYMPALRGEEWVSLRRWDSPDHLDENWINIQKGYIVVHHYKTMGTYGKRLIYLPQQLVAKIKEYYALRRGTFMLMDDKEQMPTRKLEYILKRELGASTSELRRIYISSVVPLLSNTERLKLSRIMAHSMEMQEFVYRGKSIPVDNAVLERLRFVFSCSDCCTDSL